ncbi:hypothetical protein G7054_g4539 [Neopestalotiopsis clavispora]|nr:hypothetical protein G7054_g4539 [Neopestalotiopsis clavispora]
MHFTLKTSILLLGLASSSFGATVPREGRGPIDIRGSTPKLDYDLSTTSYCTWWHDYSAVISCPDLLSSNAITLSDFRRWNPSVDEPCSNLAIWHSYCVEAAFEPAPTTGQTTTAGATTTRTTAPSTTQPPTTTTSSAGNGIETPIPTQPNIVSNCDAFYLVKTGDSCSAIAAANGITLAQFLEWNPSAGSSCGGLWADAYSCVSVIGHNATPTTSAGNGVVPRVATPTPTQATIANNCNKFYFVQAGDSCAAIASKNSIALSDFLSWNPSAGSDCTGLWANAYACIGIIGGSTTTSIPPTTTTAPGNGVTTPTPTQPEIVSNCDDFYLVKPGDTCAAIVSSHGISLAQFLAWNPAAGSSCSGLWANAYACVSIIGESPTPTSPGNGITTPTPTQAGMTANCDSFHFVEVGQTCTTIASRYGVTVANLVSWNPAIGSGCTGMWANTYLCVGVL